jgi:Fe-S-cluster containining protein
MLTPETFKCDRTCADCCKYLTVKLDKKDINKIKKAGYDQDFFLKFDNFIESPVLKLTDKGCIFLIKKDSYYYCKIYDIRPKVCRDYPFINSNIVESCKPVLLRNRFKK